jgi:hypothetical protein
MNQPRKFRRTQERHFSAHHMLIRASQMSLELAEKQDPGWLNHVLPAITFSALAMEAMGNAFGDRLVPDWQDFESSNPFAKLRLVAQHLGVEFERTKEPWSTVRWLSRFRNAIAHPKPESLVEETLIDEEQFEERMFDSPESKLEREITLVNARRAVAAIALVKEVLCERMESEDLFDLGTDGWSGSTELRNET